MIRPRSLVVGFAACLGTAHGGTPSPAIFYGDQLVDHKDTHDRRTWTQRFYAHDEHFQGPGSPIFLIMGGEGAIEPHTGLMYPFVTHHLAKSFGAYVVQPEHRFYGASQPVSAKDISKARENGQPDPREELLTYEQALFDAMRLVQLTRDKLGCSHDRFSKDYCPVITCGGSYPGFLSAMARIIFPHIVDMAYSGSAPFKFYAQQVGQTEYYDHITAVADKALPGCASAVRTTLEEVSASYTSSDKPDETALGACEGSIPSYCRDNTSVFLEETFMMVGYTFANFNMGYYPPSTETRLYKACEIFVSNGSSSLAKLRSFLVSSLSAKWDEDVEASCFEMDKQLPSGAKSTISAGDWSGVGTGQSGESWDFQTCTLCVEAIGFNSTTNMFPDRPWSLEWLTKHCQDRFGVTPRPYDLNVRWSIDDIIKSGASYILFTNGLNDGWSVSGVQEDLSDTLLAINFPNGAHHSDLSGQGPRDDDTDDIKQGFLQIRSILGNWLDQVKEQTSA